MHCLKKTSKMIKFNAGYSESETLTFFAGYACFWETCPATRLMQPGLPLYRCEDEMPGMLWAWNN